MFLDFGFIQIFAITNRIIQSGSLHYVRNVGLFCVNVDVNNISTKCDNALSSTVYVITMDLVDVFFIVYDIAYVDSVFKGGHSIFKM